ncbi:MAG: hypothetical protein A2X94_06935 [Bdellovibrionales bacterium GWB1_55_8]|nr:MAG: hypothetical protein A2X94_06935 [Bdellovibrionales bacterium GWB1_55_8]
MGKQLEIEIKVGLFVTIGIALIMVAILVLGSSENFLERKHTYTVHFKTVEGLIPGAKVVLGGVQVGTVKAVRLNPKERDIEVELSVSDESSEWIREDSRAEIATQGVLGDKYIGISPGTTDAEHLKPGSEIPVTSSAGLTQFISKGDQLMVSLNRIAGSLDNLLKSFESGNRADTLAKGMASTAKNLASASEKLNRELDHLNLKSSMANLNAILSKINNGTGTLGALVNDPGLYDDAKSLMGGVSRNRVMRNLIRQTVRESEEKSASSPVTAKEKR